MKNVLLTGSSGFIGYRTALQLLERGVRVVGVDNMNDYYDRRLKEWRLERLRKSEQFTFHELDIENLEQLSNVFAGESFDAVINLAARAGVRYSMENPHVYMTTNANGTLNLLEQVRKHEIPKFVLASTSSLYAGQEMPFVESLPVNTPISPYAATKKAAEAIAYSYHSLYKIDVTVVRYFTVFGPAGRPDMSIFRFIQWIDNGIPLKIFGDGNQSRDFTYVDDIANGTIAATRPLGYEVINLGGGNRPVSLNQVIENLEDLLGKKAAVEHLPFHQADMTSTWADISKAKDLLEWEPKISTEEGLRLTVDWYKENLPWSSEINLD